MMRRLPRFLSVGAAGFVVDFTAFAIALTLINPFAARLVAFSAAVLSTWLMNRTWTFKVGTSPRAPDEFIRYFISSTLSGACNVAVYSGLVLMLGARGYWPYLAMAAGSGVGLISNFILYSRFVFSEARGK